MGGLIEGMLAMYFLDRQRGARRRAVAIDKARHFLREARLEIARGWSDAEHRAAGMIARARSARSPEPGVGDEVLVARVRARLGRLISHPGAIEVTSRRGHVTLGGPILADEVASLISEVAAIRGVHGVSNHLDVYTSSENVPSLQGSRGVRRLASERSWTPARRLLALGASAGLLLFSGFRSATREGRGDPLALIAIGLALPLATRGISGETPRRLVMRKRAEIARRRARREHIGEYIPVVAPGPLVEPGPLLSQKSAVA